MSSNATPSATGQIDWAKNLSDADKVKIKDGRQPGVQHVGQLPTKDEVAARSSRDTDPVDGRFHRHFVLSEYDPKSNNDRMHEANVLVTHNEAMMRGLSPTEKGKFDGAKETGDGSWELSYSVAAVPAHEGKRPVAPSDILKDKKV